MPPVRSLDIRPAAHPGQSLRAAIAALLLACLPAAGSTDPAAIAREVVAARLGMPPAEVRIVTVTPRVFPDGSLGCPAADMAYAQVITPGHQVTAEAAGRRFDVRVAGSSGRICQGSAAAKPGPASQAAGQAIARAATEQARRDLAAALELPVDAVTVLTTRARGPKEALAGCGSAPAASGETVVVLGADGRQYTWLLQGDRATPCPPAAAR
jgi:hypothetical protein